MSDKKKVAITATILFEEVESDSLDNIDYKELLHDQLDGDLGGFIESGVHVEEMAEFS